MIEKSEMEMVRELRVLLQGTQWNCCLKDELLLCFVRGRKYDVSRAYKSLTKYLKMVKSYPELMANLKESELRHQLNKRLQSIVISEKSTRDQHGRHIFIFRAGLWNPEESTLDDIFRCNLYCLQRLAAEPEAQLNGIVAIADLHNIGLYQARHFTPAYAKKVADLVTGAFPLRILAIHIVRQNWIINFLLSVIAPFLPIKIKSRIHHHGDNWESLHRHVDPAVLPEDYGGEQEALDCINWVPLCKNEKDQLFDF